MGEEKKNTEELPDSEFDEVVGGKKAIYHYVKKGESILDITRRYGVTSNQVCLWNGLANPNFIKTGDRLCLFPWRV